MSFLYRRAASVLREVKEKRSSFKSLLLGDKRDASNGCNKVFALGSGTLRYMKVLEELIASIDTENQILNEESVNDSYQFWVMLYDLLIGKGSIAGGGALKRHIIKYENELRNALTLLKISKGLTSDAQPEMLLSESNRRFNFPRYVRVNLIKTSITSAIDRLSNEGYNVEVDSSIEGLLSLPPGTDLHTHPMVVEGQLILQDKSSCFPAQALIESGDWLERGDIIDCCAAPGNKTSHLASLLHNLSQPTTSHVFAFDRDKERVELLRKRCQQAGALDIVSIFHQDFLQVDSNDIQFSNVRALLLDPSCSGSGIVNAPDRFHDDDINSDQSINRIAKLAQFQLSMLLKAFSFPQAHRIVYSTCSIHEEENERVVETALKDQSNLDSYEPWKLTKCISSWKRRGIISKVGNLTGPEVDCLLRITPEDNTNGFFVALFTRNCSSENFNLLRQSKEEKFEAEGVSSVVEKIDKNEKKIKKSARKKNKQMIREQLERKKRKLNVQI